MKNHRSTQVRVSNEPQNSNFEAGTALENLRAEMVDIEALARGELRRELCRLPPALRETFELFSFQARSYQQIAGELNIATGTVGTRIAAMPPPSSFGTRSSISSFDSWSRTQS